MVCLARLEISHAGLSLTHVNPIDVPHEVDGARARLPSERFVRAEAALGFDETSLGLSVLVLEQGAQVGTQTLTLSLSDGITRQRVFLDERIESLVGKSIGDHMPVAELASSRSEVPPVCDKERLRNSMKERSVREGVEFACVWRVPRFAPVKTPLEEEAVRTLKQ